MCLIIFCTRLHGESKGLSQGKGEACGVWLPPPASVKGSLSDCSADPSLSPFDLLLGRNKHSQAEIVSLCFAALQPVIFCHRHVQIHQKKNYMFVVPIMVQCNVWGKERGGELGGRGGLQDVCYFRPTVPSLFHECRWWLHRGFLSHDDDSADPHEWCSEWPRFGSGRWLHSDACFLETAENKCIKDLIGPNEF